MHPLAGVRILELGQIIAGTYGGQVLTDLGAEVIKIESPDGDLGRIPSVAPYKGVSTLFLTFNRNKKSVVIDLKTDRVRRKLLVQKWTWVSKRERRQRKRQIEEALHRFEHFQLS
jgi:crotonobetainyl-CoA:carnitine CoA-transferase CaiB-like acyl-CoA transferase